MAKHAVEVSAIAMILAAILLATSGHWSAPAHIWAKNPYTHRWYQTREYWWVDAARPQLEEPERPWELSDAR
jgi:hypothetical protein